MDWKQVIKRNREALAVIIAGLIALAGQWTVDPRVKPEDDGLRNDPIPRSLRCAILRILRPAESALTRLIVIVVAMQQDAGSIRSYTLSNNVRAVSSSSERGTPPRIITRSPK